MKENLMVGTHKVSTEEFCTGYDDMVWGSDPKELKEAKRKRQFLAAKKAQRRSNR